MVQILMVVHRPSLQFLKACLPWCIKSSCSLVRNTRLLVRCFAFGLSLQLPAAVAQELRTINFDHASFSSSSLDQAQVLSGFFGGVFPAEKVDLSVKKEGVIYQVLVKPGDTIAKGQKVISMDSRELVARRALAEQELRKAIAIMNDPSAATTAKAQYSKTEATYNTNRQLSQKSELESFRLLMDLKDKKAVLDMAVAKHQQEIIDVSIKQEQLSMADIDLESAEIVSPIAGIVSEQLKYPGESIRLGEPILKIMQMNELMFRVEIDLKRVPPHRLADYQAEAVFELEQGGAFTLSDIQLDRLMPNNLDSQNYYALALIKNSQVRDRNGVLHWRLRPGMSGEVRLRLRDESPSINRDTKQITSAR